MDNGPGTRLSPSQVDDIFDFAKFTARAWRKYSFIEDSSWSFVMAVTRLPDIRDWSLSNLDVYEHYGYDLQGAAYNEPGKPHNAAWYRENAHGKKEICLGARMDSMEAVLLYPGIVRHLPRAFAWGGGVFEDQYCMIFTTSGFTEKQDILFSRTMRNYAVMIMDDEGDEVIADAHKRGKQLGEAAADRMTKLPSGLLVPDLPGITEQDLGESASPDDLARERLSN